MLTILGPQGVTDAAGGAEGLRPDTKRWRDEVERLMGSHDCFEGIVAGRAK